MKPIAWLIDTEEQAKAIMLLTNDSESHADFMRLMNVGNAFTIHGDSWGYASASWYESEGYEIIDLRKKREWWEVRSDDLEGFNVCKYDTEQEAIEWRDAYRKGPHGKGAYIVHCKREG